MRVEAPFSEKSSARSILTRARGLGILTFDKIKKSALQHKIKQIKTKTTIYTCILSKQNIPQKNIFKKNFMGALKDLNGTHFIIFYDEAFSKPLPNYIEADIISNPH